MGTKILNMVMKVVESNASCERRYKQHVVLPLGSQGTSRATVECPTQLRVSLGAGTRSSRWLQQKRQASACASNREAAHWSAGKEHGGYSRRKTTVPQGISSKQHEKGRTVKQPSVMASNQFIYSQARHNNHAPQTPPWPNASSK